MECGSLGRGDRIETMCGDATSSDWQDRLSISTRIRRAESDRPTKRLELYQPNLDWMQNLCRKAAGGAIKGRPASNFLQKIPGVRLNS